MEISVFKKRTFSSIAVFGTVLVHACLVYALAAMPKVFESAEEKADIVHISLIDDEKLSAPPKREEPQPPIEQPKIPNEVPKEQPKPQKKPVVAQKPIAKTAPSPEPSPIVEETVTPPPPSSHQALSALEQPSQASRASQANEDALSRYLAKVRKAIQANLQYPMMAKKMGIEGETTVQFSIQADGTVDKRTLKVLHSSGKKVLDANALNAVIDASPFEKPPQEELFISVPVVFKLRT
ncbi:TonB family protein [Sulfurospirillum sp. hDNRA2]|uniref:energy transducer TonB n=1 Tax=Sulfurospirillum sp. hDNRA2 TaxID=3237298 RepID=UPI0020B6E126|nr:energy transducer TonB [Sulfurospirillum sp. DNRA8]MCR1811671.1 energy transducer TonB [Sulfurospirillum sp. DNRA8]